MLFVNDSLSEISFPQRIPTKLTNLERKREKSNSLTLDYKPSCFDICSGRGKSYEKHEGNLWFRSLIRENAVKYENGESKSRKSKVVSSLVQQVRMAGGKFLKQDSSMRWYDMGDKEAREKVGHALRDFVSRKNRSDKAKETLKIKRRRSAPSSPCPLPASSSMSMSLSALTQERVTLEPLDYRRANSEPDVLNHALGLLARLEKDVPLNETTGNESSPPHVEGNDIFLLTLEEAIELR